MELKVFKCSRCGSIVLKLNEKGCNPSCCGTAMEEIIPGSVDASAEKHVPVCEVEGNTVTVKVGAAEHPMLEAHYIEWIAITTNQAWQIHYLKPGDEPKAVFAIAQGEQVEHAYAFCNLHSLWMA